MVSDIVLDGTVRGAQLCNIWEFRHGMGCQSWEGGLGEVSEE